MEKRNSAKDAKKKSERKGEGGGVRIRVYNTIFQITSIVIVFFGFKKSIFNFCLPVIILTLTKILYEKQGYNF